MNIKKYKVEIIDFYTIDLVRKNRNKIFVFGDNMIRKGKKGQAIIRNEPNAVGVITKKFPSYLKSAYLTDKEYKKNIELIEKDIQKLIKLAEQGYVIVFPKNGLGTGLAKLKEKAPKTYNYLKTRLLEVFGFDNDKGILVNYSLL